MKKLLILWLFSISVIAAPNQQPLPVDQAFSFSAHAFGKDTIVLQWNIAPHCYLYRDRFHFKALKPAQAEIGAVLFPAGQFKEDKILGRYQVYANQARISVPISHADLHHTELVVTYQGCAESGYCYPPTTRKLNINFNKNSISISNTIPTTIQTTPIVATNTQEQLFLDLFADHHLATTLLAFLGFGILLSLTPCVLPMIPILSGIIVGHQKTVLRGKAFKLSCIYVLSMAITYAIAGVLVGWLGGSVQAAFQQPWVIILFSLLFVLLALSFFGVYSLKLPARFEQRIANISRHQKSGHYLSVAIMGCLATLIVSPCVTPALVGVLGYISKTGDALLGGATLFMLGLGMGAPLLLIGIAGNKFLPKAGPWMTVLEHGFGILFLGIAILMLERLIPPSLTLMLWSSLLVICAVYLGAFAPTPTYGWGKFHKGLGLVIFIYGFLLAAGAAQGNSNPFQPLSFSSAPQNNTSFITVKNLAETERALAYAKTQHKPILIDFYADWCTACKEMKSTTFKDPAVMATLDRFVVLKADVTASNRYSSKLMQHFQVIAPPTFLLFDAQGQPLKNMKRVGQMNAKEFLEYLAGT